MPFNFEAKIRAIQSSYNRTPKILANEMLKFSREAFKNEAFSDNAPKSDPWAQRKRLTKQDKRTGRRRALLVQSGALRRSLKVVSARWGKIEVGSVGVKYATIHNRGGQGKAFGQYSFKMPKRQFVGHSDVLRRRLKAKLKREVIKILLK